MRELAQLVCFRLAQYMLYIYRWSSLSFVQRKKPVYLCFWGKFVNCEFYRKKVLPNERWMVVVQLKRSILEEILKSPVIMSRNWLRYVTYKALSVRRGRKWRLKVFSHPNLHYCDCVCSSSSPSCSIFALSYIIQEAPLLSFPSILPLVRFFRCRIFFCFSRQLGISKYNEGKTMGRTLSFSDKRGEIIVPSKESANDSHL